ncbi:MAG: hypothetical protein K9W44_09720 [Candidatus Lokiarchaeota archaeon]|nr:hypothetical protein [Candidatus Harpocratesius repetitus]
MENNNNKNNKDYSFDLNSPQATLMLPLWGRAECTNIDSDIISDPFAVEILPKLLKKFKVDISTIKKKLRNKMEYMYLVFSARAYTFDLTIKHFCLNIQMQPL